MIIRTLLLMQQVSGAHAEVKINPTSADEIPAVITGDGGSLI